MIMPQTEWDTAYIGKREKVRRQIKRDRQREAIWREEPTCPTAPPMKMTLASERILDERRTEETRSAKEAQDIAKEEGDWTDHFLPMTSDPIPATSPPSRAPSVVADVMSSCDR